MRSCARGLSCLSEPRSPKLRYAPRPRRAALRVTILRASARRQGLSPLSTGNEERRPPRDKETTLPVVNGGNPRFSRTSLPIPGWLVARRGIIEADLVGHSHLRSAAGRRKIRRGWEGHPPPWPSRTRCARQCGRPEIFSGTIVPVARARLCTGAGEGGYACSSGNNSVSILDRHAARGGAAPPLPGKCGALPGKWG